MKSKEYELLVREIYQQILDQDKVGNVVVEHDVLKQGIATKHQIDVYWEFTRGGISHRVAVQVKQWKRPISKGAMLTFKGVLDDLPGTVGVMVTAQGYQQGALEVATKYGITICELKEDVPLPKGVTPGSTLKISIKGRLATVEGKPFGFAVQIDYTTPEFSDLKFQGDEDWFRGMGIPVSATSNMQFNSSEVGFYNSDGEFLYNLKKVLGEMSDEVCVEFNKLGEVGERKTRSFDQPMYVKVPTLPDAMKVNSLSVRVKLQRRTEQSEMRAKNVAVFILKNLTDGDSKRFAQLP